MVRGRMWPASVRPRADSSAWSQTLRSVIGTAPSSSPLPLRHTRSLTPTIVYPIHPSTAPYTFSPLLRPTMSVNEPKRYSVDSVKALPFEFNVSSFFSVIGKPETQRKVIRASGDGALVIGRYVGSARIPVHELYTNCTRSGGRRQHAATHARTIQRRV